MKYNTPKKPNLISVPGTIVNAEIIVITMPHIIRAAARMARDLVFNVLDLYYHFHLRRKCIMRYKIPINKYARGKTDQIGIGIPFNNIFF